jgi:cysteinyl-tRNA synthetase
LDDTVLTHVANDLNTPGALARLHELAKAGDAAALLVAGQFLGLLGADETWWRPKEARGDAALRVEALIEARRQAKAARDFAAADAIRAQLSAAGVEVVDKPGGLSEAVITDAFNPDLLG